MPYIKKSDREALAHLREAESAGELNYQFTVLAVQYLNQHGKSYKTCAEIVSAFECAKLEFYRKVVAPYENEKAIENGEVYPEGTPAPSPRMVDPAMAGGQVPGSWVRVT